MFSIAPAQLSPSSPKYSPTSPMASPSSPKYCQYTCFLLPTWSLMTIHQPPLHRRILQLVSLAYPFPFKCLLMRMLFPTAPAYCEYLETFLHAGLIPSLTAPASPAYSPTSPSWSPSSPAQNGTARRHNYQTSPSWD